MRNLYYSMALFIGLGLLYVIADTTQGRTENLPVIPDPVLTPGVVASTNEAEVCGTINGQSYSRRHRKTSAALKAQTFKRYGIVKGNRKFEVDHRIELSLGGADVIENLWPEAAFTHPGFRAKDKLETEIWHRVCKHHTMTLHDGQAIFLNDWREGYRAIFGTAP